MRFVKLILFITPLVFVTSCDKFQLINKKPIYLSCVGTIDKGLMGNEIKYKSTEMIKSNITLTISKKNIDIKGDGTQIEFLSDKTICSEDEEIKFNSNNCESTTKQIERLTKLYKDTNKIVEQKDFEDQHKVFGIYNKINKSLFIFREDSTCKENSYSKSCGLYSEGKYQCEKVDKL